jgi:hypothetical protein
MSDLDRHKTVRLTTRGRKSGEPRTVIIWFVADGPRRVRVQHVARHTGPVVPQLIADPEVTLDFGDGPIVAQARPITDRGRGPSVLASIRRRYWTAPLIQWFGRKATPVAAEITW